MAGRKKPEVGGAAPSRDGAQLAGNINLIRLLVEKPELGLLFLVVLAVQPILTLVFVRSNEGWLQALALVMGFVLMAAVLLVFYKQSKKPAPSPAVPESLLAEAVPVQAVERLDEPANAPDGTFAFRPPPTNWSVKFTTVAEDVARRVAGTLFDGTKAEDLNRKAPFQAGALVVFSENTGSEIEYVPGQSTKNGRFVVGILPETVRDEILMFSASKQGSMMRDVTAEHLLIQELGAQAQLGVRFIAIDSAPAPLSGLSTLSARGEIGLGKVRINGGAVQDIAIEMAIAIAERQGLFYIIKSIHVAGVKHAETRKGEAKAIIDSFVARPTADAESRLQADRAKADQVFENAMLEVAPGVLATITQQIIVAMMAADPPAPTSEQLVNLRRLTAYAKAFPAWVPAEMTERLEKLVGVSEAALKGSSAPLLELLAPEPAETGAP